MIPIRTTLTAATLALSLCGACEAGETPPQNEAKQNEAKQEEAKQDRTDALKVLRKRLKTFDAVEADLAQGVATLKGQVPSLVAKRRVLDVARTLRGVRAVIDRLEVVTEPRSVEELKRDLRAALLHRPGVDSRTVRALVLSAGRVQLTGWVATPAHKRYAEEVVSGVRGVASVENKLDVRFAARTPQAIEADLELILRRSVWVSPKHLILSVEDGAVTLSGYVESPAARSKLIELASGVPGVKRVDASAVRTLAEGPDPERAEPYARPSDDEIAAALEATLRLDPRVPSHAGIQVAVTSGAVKLSGVVAHPVERALAGEDASNVLGVWSVTNELVVKAAEVPLPALQLRVAACFARDPYLHAESVEVGLKQGALVLSGTVSSDFVRDRAGILAAYAAGTTSVKNALVVSSKVTPKRDAELQSRIRAQLFWSADVPAPLIQVEVRDGVAYLSGSVRTLRERSAAERNAREAGAKRVVNNLKADAGATPEQAREPQGKPQKARVAIPATPR